MRDASAGDVAKSFDEARRIRSLALIEPERLFVEIPEGMERFDADISSLRPRFKGLQKFSIPFVWRGDVVARRAILYLETSMLCLYSTNRRRAVVSIEVNKARILKALGGEPSGIRTRDPLIKSPRCCPRRASGWVGGRSAGVPSLLTRQIIAG